MPTGSETPGGACVLPSPVLPVSPYCLAADLGLTLAICKPGKCLLRSRRTLWEAGHIALLAVPFPKAKTLEGSRSSSPPTPSQSPFLPVVTSMCFSLGASPPRCHMKGQQRARLSTAPLQSGGGQLVVHLLPCPVSRPRVRPPISEPAFRTVMGPFRKALTAFLIREKDWQKVHLS